MNHNKHNLKVGDVVILDKGARTESEVEIQRFTPNQVYAMITPIQAQDSTIQWEVMTNRLSPITTLVGINK